MRATDWWPVWAAAVAIAFADLALRHRWIGVGATLACLTALALGLRRAGRAGPGTALGRRTGPPWTQLRLSGEERLRHVHCLGPSGSGKTTSVLMPMLGQDVAWGHGVTVIEIKGGDLGARAREAATRAGRPLAAWEPAGGGTVGWNPLDDPGPGTAERLIYALHRAGGGASAASDYYAAVGAGVIRHSVGAFGSAGAPLDLLRLRAFLVDPQARQRILREVRDSLVREYFLTVFEAWRPDERLRNVQGILNHIDGLLAHPEVRRSLCPPDGAPRLDLAAHLAAGGLLVVTLPLGGMLRLADALGALLLSTLQAEVYRRPAPHPRHFVYLDEFQHFAGPGFAEFLALCRGFGVGTVLAHQNLSQLRAAGGPDLAETVLANARTTVILRCDQPDAQTLAQRLPRAPGSAPAPERLAALPFGQALVARSGRRGRPRADVVRLRFGR